MNLCCFCMVSSFVLKYSTKKHFVYRSEKCLSRSIQNLKQSYSDPLVLNTTMAFQALISETNEAVKPYTTMKILALYLISFSSYYKNGNDHF